MYAEVVAGLINTKSPRKKTALQKRGITPPGPNVSHILESVKTTCQSLKAGRRRHFISEMTGHLDKKHGLKQVAAKNLGIHWNYLMKYSRLRRENQDVEKRKVRCDSLDESIKKRVADHYLHPNMSTVMPNKKGVDGGKPKHVLQRSLSETYKRFCEVDNNPSIGFSKFASLRPENVLVQSKAKLYQCLCETCTNVDLALKAVNQAAISAKCPSTINDRYLLSEMTMCSTENPSADLSCIDRQCLKCGVDQLDDYFKPLLDTSSDTALSWLQWGKTEYSDGKKRVTRQRHHGTVSQLLQKLKSLLEKLPCHLFQAKWQQTQFYAISNNPPANAVVLVMDFAENYLCTIQHEVQSAHWYVAQVALHPMVAYYWCSVCDQQNPVREAINFISDDMKHDSHAVHHFITTAVNHLTKVRGLTPQRLIQFSDGCASQYKSRIPFMDVSCGPKDLGIQQVERHFFGSSHGKNPCDGEGGIFKNAASRAVHSEAGVSIADAESFFEFCKERLSKGPTDVNGRCSHSRRIFFHVKTEDINHQRPTRSKVTAIAGTRQIHAAVGVEPHKLKVRRLSCFCEACNAGEAHNCVNVGYAGTWTVKKLKVKDLPGQEDSSVVVDRGNPTDGNREVDAPVDMGKSATLVTQHLPF